MWRRRQGNYIILQSSVAKKIKDKSILFIVQQFLRNINCLRTVYKILGTNTWSKKKSEIERIVVLRNPIYLIVPMEIMLNLELYCV